MTDNLFINGTWQTGEAPPTPLIDPCTGAQTDELPGASEKQVEAALQAARHAFPAWADRAIGERADILLRYADLLRGNAEELTLAISRETGKPPWEARAEANAMIAKVDISLKAQQTRCAPFGSDPSRTRFRPHGVIAVLGPFNFPGHLPNGHLVPALLAGNAIVLKPSEHTPRTAILMTRLLAEAGIPDGVLNLVHGAGETGARLCGHHQIDGIFFTGSSRTGKAIAQANADRPGRILALEMGGNNPLVVAEAPDPDAAALAIVQSAFLTAGQRCTCARRLVLVENDANGGKDATEALLARLLSITENLRIAPPPASPDEAEAFCGPLIPPGGARSVLHAQKKLIEAGARPLLEAALLRENTGLLSPAILDLTSMTDRPDEEVFGPLLQIIRVPGLDAAIAEANATRYGLAAGLLSPNPGHYRRFRHRVRAGIINWNQQLTGASSASPFGGTGDSGNHRPSAFFAADYCNRPVASMESPALSLPAELPPGVTLC